jgi:iron complex transport system ATP-binding protein
MTISLASISARLGGRPVLMGATVTLAPGEVLGVIGPNGAGKSTLLRIAAGLLPPAGGSAKLDDTELAAWDRHALGRRIAFLPQDRTVHWPLAVRAVVALGRLPHRSPAAAESAEDSAAIERAMREADVAHLADRPVSALSGGERARVLLARALAQNTAILIADEPAAGLDPAHQLDLFDRFTAMTAAGRSVIVALHDLTAAARYCHRLLLLAGGRQLALGAPRDVLTPALLASGYGIAAHQTEIDGVTLITPLHRLRQGDPNSQPAASD